MSEFLETERDLNLNLSIYNYPIGKQSFVRLCLTEENYALAWQAAPNFKFDGTPPMEFVIRQFASGKKLEEFFAGDKVFLPWKHKGRRLAYLSSFYFTRAEVKLITGGVDSKVIECEILDDERRTKYYEFLQAPDKLAVVAFLRYDFVVARSANYKPVHCVFTAHSPEKGQSDGYDLGIQLPRKELLKKTVLNWILKTHHLHPNPKDLDMDRFSRQLEELLKQPRQLALTSVEMVN